ncbi:hypothetical protein FLONG3_2561 [Fusarium longipes]|uniref:DUF1772-domain-containing protein n=1 Tax=Fusarium longipes TaxID=694270 RepID=A0A395T4T0_9HYPO|nr:hypothetical protein FLONG3_2561 [Fusarium longipes]
MAFLQNHLPALKGIAIAGSLINGGTMTSGYRLLPSIYPTVQNSPKDAAKQWEFFYWNMSATVPLIDLTTFITIGTIAYTEYKENSSALAWKIWAGAGALMPLGWIWVRKVMLVPSNKLLAIADAKSSEDQPLKAASQNVISLLREFNSQMALRMMFPWVVGGLAMWATLGL